MTDGGWSSSKVVRLKSLPSSSLVATCFPRKLSRQRDSGPELALMDILSEPETGRDLSSSIAVSSISVVSVPFEEAMGDGSAMSLLGLKGWGDFCGPGWRWPLESLDKNRVSTRGTKTRLRLSQLMQGERLIRGRSLVAGIGWRAGRVGVRREGGHEAAAGRRHRLNGGSHHAAGQTRIQEWQDRDAGIKEYRKAVTARKRPGFGLADL